MSKSVLLRVITYGVLLISTNSCIQEVEVEKEYIVVGRINKVLILGNSITITKPVPEIGWNAHWGMAASAEENDYVHILINKFKSYNDSVEVRYASVSNFEREFWNYDYSQLDGFRDFDPDLIIIRLGENVDNAEAVDRRFDTHLLTLISYITRDKPAAILCTGTFWPREVIDFQIKSLATAERYIYVPLVDLFEDRTNTAVDKFEDPQVAIHPSDKGMRMIADRIAGKLRIF